MHRVHQLPFGRLVLSLSRSLVLSDDLLSEDSVPGRSDELIASTFKAAWLHPDLGAKLSSIFAAAAMAGRESCFENRRTSKSVN